MESLNSQMNLSNIVVTENVSPNKNTQQSNSHTAQSGSGLMGSLKGGAGSIMKNIRDKSHSVIQTVQHSMATKGNLLIKIIKMTIIESILRILNGNSPMYFITFLYRTGFTLCHRTSCCNVLSCRRHRISI